MGLLLLLLLLLFSLFVGFGLFLFVVVGFEDFGLEIEVFKTFGAEFKVLVEGHLLVELEDKQDEDQVGDDLGNDGHGLGLFSEDSGKQLALGSGEDGLQR